MERVAFSASLKAGESRAPCLPSDALSPADQIMPPWIVLVDCRASGHIWKSRQYKGNALGVLSTSLPRSRHVVATWRYSFECVHLKEFVLSKVFFLDGVRASSAGVLWQFLKAEAKGRNWGELIGRDWRDDWQAMLGGANRLLFDHEKAVWPTGRLRTVLRLG